MNPGIPSPLQPFLGKQPVLRHLFAQDGGMSERECDAVRTGDFLSLAGGKSGEKKRWAELVRGGLFYALDALEEAHAIFQDDASAEGSYWHGMLHRREGDFGNACYWFQRAGKLTALGQMPEFSPLAFTRDCEREASRTGEISEPLASLQRREWSVMLNYCWQRAGGLPTEAVME